MNSRCPSCNSCGMPLEKAEDCLQGTPYCIYCVNKDGSLKTYQQVLQGTVDHLVHSQGLSEKAASHMAESMLKDLPAWKNA